jgi:hypothetical protein
MIVDVINRSGDVVLESAIIMKSDEKRFYLLTAEGFERSVLMSDLDSGKYTIKAAQSREKV